MIHSKSKGSKPEELIMMMKLVNGDTIIGNLIDDDDRAMVVSDVCLVITMMGQSEEGMSKRVYYTEWFSFGDSTLHMIMKSHLVSASLPSERATKEYADYISQKKDLASGPSPKKSTLNWDGLGLNKLDGDPGRMNN